jgi:hypothetical protein
MYGFQNNYNIINVNLNWCFRLNYRIYVIKCTRNKSIFKFLWEVSVTVTLQCSSNAITHRKYYLVVLHTLLQYLEYLPVHAFMVFRIFPYTYVLVIFRI